MPSYLGLLFSCFTDDINYSFRGSANSKDTSVIQNQAIAIPKPTGLNQIEKKILAGVIGQTDSPPVTVMKR
jgi:hypothetical protein